MAHSGTEYNDGFASFNKWPFRVTLCGDTGCQVEERTWKIIGRRISWARSGSDPHHLCSHSIGKNSLNFKGDWKLQPNYVPRKKRKREVGSMSSLAAIQTSNTSVNI